MSAVAGGSSTLSKYCSQFPENFPTHLVKAYGSRVVADDGRQFTDWISGGLAVLLGHEHPAVTNAVVRHLQSGGPTWSLPHPLEEEVAETILRLTGFEGGKVRFLKTGSEACSAALRIARAVTRRNRVLDFGTYHGWHDQFQHSLPAWGVPPMAVEDVKRVRRPKPELLDFDGVAAVIVEPDASPQPLDTLSEQCRSYNSLLIFDECKSGGRYHEFVAAQHYGVQPDLLVLSKCLANGWPLACVVGTAEVMACLEPGWRDKGPVYLSGTYSSETASLAAAQATLRVWERERVAEQLQALGGMLRSGLIDAAAHGITIGGAFYRIVLGATTLELRTAVAAFLAERGHLIAPGGGWCVTAAHTTDDVGEVTEIFEDAMVAIGKGYDGGRPVRPLYI